jgi:glycosyltransferase involved in cell wall biosynthesis
MPPASEPRVVCSLIPTLSGGGAERVVLNLMKALPGVRHRLVLFERKLEYPYSGELDVLGGDFSTGGTVADKLGKLGASLVILARLKRDVGRATWLSFTTLANILNVLTPLGGRVVISSHNRESENIQGRAAPIIRKLVSLTYPRADLIVTVSDSVKADLVRHFGIPANKIVTIYNTVDLEEVRALAAAPLDAPLAAVLARPSVVTAGRLIPQKGQWHLVRAFAALKSREPNAVLVVVGKGVLGPYLTTLARDAGLSVWAEWEHTEREAMRDADVVFTGFLRNPFAVLSRARVFAFPSLWEGFGNVIIEALAAGAPVISSDCQAGPREILAPETPPSRSAAAAEQASAGILMPIFDGERRAADVPLSPVEAMWTDTLAALLADGALRQRLALQGVARASAFAIDAMREPWARALFPGAVVT